jgi:hypothetical protein
MMTNSQLDSLGFSSAGLTHGVLAATEGLASVVALLSYKRDIPRGMHSGLQRVVWHLSGADGVNDPCQLTYHQCAHLHQKQDNSY